MGREESGSQRGDEKVAELLACEVVVVDPVEDRGVDVSQ